MAVFTPTTETFYVEEIPAYLPQGDGSHTYLWIEKKDLTTPEAIKRLARALGAPDREMGYAGLKDRHATTWQWVSVPNVDPAVAMAAEIPQIKVIEAKRHGNKLRVGHLKGNRFEVLLTEVEPSEATPIQTTFEAICRAGLPNVFGHQRFGRGQDNAKIGLAVLRRERREPDPRKRRFFLSALQSEIFNRTLALREESGGLMRVRPGDVLQKTDSGGSFVTQDPATDQARVDAGELVPTGPMPGGRAIDPPNETEAWALEARALEEVGVTREEMAAAGRDLPGTRRPVVVAVTADANAVSRDDRTLRLRFSLPSGSYATVLLDALAERLAQPKPMLTLRLSAAP